MKKYFAVLLILLLPAILLADIASSVSKADAEKSVAFLKKIKRVKNYCAPCGDKTAKTETISEVSAAAVDKTKYWQVSVNGSETDLAYIYYKTKAGRWRNVAVALGVKVEGVVLKDEVPEYIPDAALKNGD